MSGHHPWSELIKDWPEERRRRNEAMVERHLAALPKHRLRQARALVQHDVAESLGVKQNDDDPEKRNFDHPDVRKAEERADLYLASLRSRIEQLGGSLKVVAEFPDGDVPIAAFAGIGDMVGEDYDIDVDELGVEDEESARAEGESIPSSKKPEGQESSHAAH